MLNLQCDSVAENPFVDCAYEPKMKTKILNYRFSKLGDHLCARKNFTIFLDDQDFTIIEFLRFQSIGLLKCKTFLKQLNCRKSMDHCDVPVLALVLIYTFVQCLSFLTAEQFPCHLKRGQKIPIYKIRDTSIYRPISMTFALSKRSEKVMRDQTDHYLEKNHLFSPIQFAFRRGFFLQLMPSSMQLKN